MIFLKYSKNISLVLFLLFLWSGIDQWSAGSQWTLLILFFLSLFLLPFLRRYYSTDDKPLIKEAEENQPERTWWKDFGGIVYHIIAAIGIGAGAKMHENDFGGLRFLSVSILAGVLSGLFICQFVRIAFPQWRLFQHQKMEIYLYAILSCVFLAVCTGPLINQYKTKGQARCREFIIHPGDRKRNSNEKYISLVTDKGKERFEPPTRLLHKIKDGDSVLVLCIKKGRLGFEYVEEFRLAIPVKKDPGNR